MRMHIDESYILPNGKLDIIKLRPLSRLGYADYTSITEVFEMSTGSMKKAPVPGQLRLDESRVAQGKGHL